MRHADHDLLHAQRAAALDDLLHRGDQAFAAVEAEALGAHVLDVQEFLEALGLDHLVQDRLSTFPGERDLLAVAFDPLLQPRGLLGVGNVHVLQREGAAVGAFHDVEDLPDRPMLKPQHVVEEDGPIHVGLGEAVGFRIELGMRGLVAHAQRVEIGNEVPPDPVGADQHERPDRVEHGALDLRVVEGDALFRRLVLDLAARFLDLRRDGRPLSGQRVGPVVLGLRRPVGA